MRGEYRRRFPPATTPQELPPRARRILIINQAVISMIGTTSACAENTHSCSPRGRAGRNYLRVRGEYNKICAMFAMNKELPPRARRIPSCKSSGLPSRGTTSACAENTHSAVTSVATRRNYLRVRGEYMRWPRNPLPLRELPPRARRILKRTAYHYWEQGATSACAENTNSSIPPERR